MLRWFSHRLFGCFACIWIVDCVGTTTTTSTTTKHTYTTVTFCNLHQYHYSLSLYGLVFSLSKRFFVCSSLVWLVSSCSAGKFYYYRSIRLVRRHHLRLRNILCSIQKQRKTNIQFWTWYLLIVFLRFLCWKWKWRFTDPYSHSLSFFLCFIYFCLFFYCFNFFIFFIALHSGRMKNILHCFDDRSLSIGRSIN